MTDTTTQQQQLAAQEQRINQLEAKYQELATKLEENTVETKATRENTSRLVELMESMQGAMRVLEAIGRFFRPLGFIAVFISASLGIWASIKNGVMPK